MFFLYIIETTKAIENRHLIANSCDSEFTLSDVNNEFCKVDSGRTQLLRLYTCHCKASFKHKSWYLKHQLTHKAGTLECDKCSKVFKRKDNLRRHLTKHFGGTIYKCQKCPSTFNMKFNLSYHMKTKHGNVCFSCPKCDKNFCDSRQLNYHDNRIHTGLMPFECIVCNMRFHAPNDLYRHHKLKVIIQFYKHQIIIILNLFIFFRIINGHCMSIIYISFVVCHVWATIRFSVWGDVWNNLCTDEKYSKSKWQK